MMKKTLILGATTNTDRISYLAAEKLLKYGHEIVPIGIKKGEIFGIPIVTEKHIYHDIDTITMYIGAKNQAEWYDYILQTHPKRIIFNPGTENDELINLAEEQGILCEMACTLVLLGAQQY